MKIQDLLGNVYGFMDLIVFIFGFLYSFYYKFWFDTYLFNTLVYFGGENEYNLKSLKFFGMLNKIGNFNFKTSDIINTLEKSKKYKNIYNFFNSFINTNGPDYKTSNNRMIRCLEIRKKLKKIRESRIFQTNKVQNPNRYSLDILNNRRNTYKIDDYKQIMKREKIIFSVSENMNNDLEDYTKKLL